MDEPNKKNNGYQFLDTIKDNEFLVLGAGVVQPRKGIDIFVWVADQL